MRSRQVDKERSESSSVEEKERATSLGQSVLGWERREVRSWRRSRRIASGDEEDGGIGGVRCRVLVEGENGVGMQGGHMLVLCWSWSRRWWLVEGQPRRRGAQPVDKPACRYCSGKEGEGTG